ncbi:MAG: RDD family protein, partial [Candidatus Rokuibacteriota bacterium]
PAPAAPPGSVSVDAAAPATQPRPAGFWIRVGAVLIDVVCVMAAEAVFGLLLWALADDRLSTAASRAFRFLAGPCYFVFLHWTRGQTLGKMAFRIRVVDLRGGPLSFGQAVLRHLGSWFAAVILGLGYLLVAFRADKRGLHDLVAGTRVEHVT